VQLLPLFLLLLLFPSTAPQTMSAPLWIDPGTALWSFDTNHTGISQPAFSRGSSLLHSRHGLWATTRTGDALLFHIDTSTVGSGYRYEPPPPPEEFQVSLVLDPPSLSTDGGLVYATVYAPRASTGVGGETVAGDVFSRVIGLDGDGAESFRLRFGGTVSGVAAGKYVYATYLDGTGTGGMVVNRFHESGPAEVGTVTDSRPYGPVILGSDEHGGECAYYWSRPHPSNSWGPDGKSGALHRVWVDGEGEVAEKELHALDDGAGAPLALPGGGIVARDGTGNVYGRRAGRNDSSGMVWDWKVQLGGVTTGDIGVQPSHSNKYSAIFLPCGDTVYSLNAGTGAVLWSAKLTGLSNMKVQVSPVEDFVYAITNDGTIHQLDIGTGAWSWSHHDSTKSGVEAELSLSDNGSTLFYATLSGEITALTTVGELRTPEPTETPTKRISLSPSALHSTTPSTGPSVVSSSFPSAVHSTTPSAGPSVGPSSLPSSGPSSRPSSGPSVFPSILPTMHPSDVPSRTPSVAPSGAPSDVPTLSKAPSDAPSRPPSINPTAADKKVDIKNFDVVIGFAADNSAVNLFELRRITEEHLSVVYKGTTGRLENFRWVELAARGFRKQKVSVTVPGGTRRRRAQAAPEIVVIVTFGGGFVFQGAPVADTDDLYELVRGAFVGANNFMYHERLQNSEDEILQLATQVSFQKSVEGVARTEKGLLEGSAPSIFMAIAFLSTLTLLGLLIARKRRNRTLEESSIKEPSIKSVAVYDSDGVSTLSSITGISSYFVGNWMSVGRREALEFPEKNLSPSDQMVTIDSFQRKQSEKFEGNISIIRVSSSRLISSGSERLGSICRSFRNT